MCLIEERMEGLDNDCVVGTVLMDLSKVFDCISHDLVFAKIAAYSLNFNDLTLIISYLQVQQQCVKINNIQSDL